jgi:alkanesulfonate monooxygenase SsuD/methylene tetrahydromethanopterin reductase-like flavin-dependent oxidoreductase (luciferase family)
VYAPLGVVKRWFDGYRNAARELGYEADPEKIVLTLPIYVAETDEIAEREARPAVEWLFHQGLKQSMAMVMPPGYMSAQSMRGVLMSGMKPYPDLSYEELVKGGFVLVGSAATVTERLQQNCHELGFGSLNAQLTFGNLRHYHTVKSLALFAKEVMPKLRAETGH